MDISKSYEQASWLDHYNQRSDPNAILSNIKRSLQISLCYSWLMIWLVPLLCHWFYPLPGNFCMLWIWQKKKKKKKKKKKRKERKKKAKSTRKIKHT